MVEENNFHSENKLDIESELFASISTILNAFKKYKEGILKKSFFQRKVRKTIHDLVKLNFYLDENKINLSKLLERMNFIEQYYKAIEIINKLSALEFNDNLPVDMNSTESIGSKTISSTVLELPSITLEITSTFITLMDALKLKGFHEIEIINKLFNDLNVNISKFPGIDDIQKKVNKIHKKAMDKYQTIDNVDSFIEELVDDIYKTFKEFQSKLNLKA